MKKGKESLIRELVEFTFLKEKTNLAVRKEEEPEKELLNLNLYVPDRNLIELLSRWNLLTYLLMNLSLFILSVIELNYKGKHMKFIAWTILIHLLILHEL